MTIIQIEWFFVLLCIIVFIYQICLLHFLRVKENKKNWSCFLGTNIAVFIANLIAMLTFGDGAIGLGSAVFMLMICIPTFVFNTVLLVAGIVLKKRKTAPTNPLVVIINTIVVFLCSIFVLLIIPSHLDKIQEEKGRLVAEQFLINRYGDHNYKFEKGNKYYENYGMWDKEFAGYTYTVEADCIKNDTFIVEVSQYNFVDNDSFLQTYYSQQLGLKYNTASLDPFEELEEYFRQEEGLEDFNIHKLNNFVNRHSSDYGIEYDDYFYVVPENNGKIPTIEEFKEALKEVEGK